MACGDVLSLEDLQTAKRHQIFEAEVITGKAGGVAGGANIGTATNPVTGQTQQTLPSILADLGFDVQSWTSSTGGVQASANQVFLNDTPGSLGLGDYYAWGGTFPKTVPAGTDPALPTSGYIMRSSRFAGTQAREAIRRICAEAGDNLVDGSFEAGGTLVNANDVLLQERTGKVFSGPAGTVAAGTNPASGGFIDRRGELLRSAMQGRYVYSGKNIVDLLSESELARLLINDPSLDLTAKIQSLIDEQKPFYLASNRRHYCDGLLQMKSGAKIIGAGQGTNQTGADAEVETAIIFNQATTNIGVQLSSASGWVTDWAIDGATLDTLSNSSAILSFKMLNTTSGHQGCYNGKLHAYIRGAQYGAYIDSSFWNVDLDLRIRGCYKPYVKTASGYSTSLSGWIKVSFCFHGVDISNTTYSPISFWFDGCGLSAPQSVVDAATTTELPILLKVANSQAISGTMGVENSKAQWINIRSYSSINYTANYYNSPSNVFVKDPARISNVALADQGVIYTNNSQVKLRGIIASNLTSSGYPPVNASDPTYFITGAGTDNPRVAFEGCFINMPSFACNTPAMDGCVSAPTYENGAFLFGLGGVDSPINWKSGIMQFGVSTTQTYHQISLKRPFVEGETALTVTGSTGASSVKFSTVNGGSANATNCALNVSMATSNSRSINARGTVNTSGADYAEYMRKSEGCGGLPKGAICGVDVNGMLTDRFDEAISFVIKSTDPSFVGGDTWFTEKEPSVPLNADGEEDPLCPVYLGVLSDYKQRLEDARRLVDRIAFSGQVPVNVTGAKPGDFIVPKRNEDGTIGGKPIGRPTLDEYQISVGKVWRVLDDGRAFVVVRVV